MTLTKKTDTLDGLPFILLTPDDLGPGEHTKHPLIVFLHGAGERGGDELSETSLKTVEKNGIPCLAVHEGLPAVGGREFPFLVAAPQTADYWSPHVEARRIVALVDRLIDENDADPARCYLTGISMGAFACWEIAALDPERFAAIVPVSGGVPPEAAQTQRLSAWVFAGGEDQYYSLDAVRDGLRNHRERGAETTLTIEPGAGHEDRFWNRLYEREALYSWMLGRRVED